MSCANAISELRSEGPAGDRTELYGRTTRTVLGRPEVSLGGNFSAENIFCDRNGRRLKKSMAAASYPEKHASTQVLDPMMCAVCVREFRIDAL